jgi:hypothetical protein
LKTHSVVRSLFYGNPKCRFGIVIYGRPLESKRFFDLRQGGFAVIKPHIHHFCKADDFRRRFEIAERVGVGMQVG